MKKIRVFLADDHAVVREGLKRIIENEPDMRIIGETHNGRDAVEAVARLRPDVTLLDISMPEMNGAESIRALRQKIPDLVALILTVHEDKSYVRELMEAGAAGYVLKRTAGEELVRAIRVVANGDVYVDPRVAGKLVNSCTAQKREAPTRDVKLSKREEGVLRLIARGYSNKEIAGQLGVSVKTVETYKARAMEKLGLRSRVDTVRFAHDLGWLI